MCVAVGCGEVDVAAGGIFAVCCGAVVDVCVGDYDSVGGGVGVVADVVDVLDVVDVWCCWGCRVWWCSLC